MTNAELVERQRLAQAPFRRLGYRSGRGARVRLRLSYPRLESCESVGEHAAVRVVAERLEGPMTAGCVFACVVEIAHLSEGVAGVQMQRGIQGPDREVDSGLLEIGIGQPICYGEGPEIPLQFLGRIALKI